MKLRKTISVISTLTIATSVLAFSAISANAAEKVLLEGGTTDKPWTSDTLNEFTAQYSNIAENHSFTINNNSAFLSSYEGTSSVTKSFNFSEDSTIRLEAGWLASNPNAKYFYQKNYAFFKLGELSIINNNTLSPNSLYFLNNSELTNSLDELYNDKFDTLNSPYIIQKNVLWNKNVTTPDVLISDPHYYKIDIEIDTKTKTLNHLYIYDAADTTTKLINITDTPLTGSDYSTLSMGFNMESKVSNTQVEILKSIKVTETTPDESNKYTATNEGAFIGENDGSKATAFSTNLADASGQVKNIEIQSSQGNKTYTNGAEFTFDTTLTNANVILGIIVNGLEDASAACTVTVE